MKLNTKSFRSFFGLMLTAQLLIINSGLFAITSNTLDHEGCCFGRKHHRHHRPSDKPSEGIAVHSPNFAGLCSASLIPLISQTFNTGDNLPFLHSLTTNLGINISSDGTTFSPAKGSGGGYYLVTVTFTTKPVTGGSTAFIGLAINGALTTPYALVRSSATPDEDLSFTLQNIIALEVGEIAPTTDTLSVKVLSGSVSLGDTLLPSAGAVITIIKVADYQYAISGSNNS